MLDAVEHRDMTNARLRFLRAVYTRYIDELRGYLHRTLRSSQQDADDVAQAAFTRLAAQKAPHKIENPRAYLYQTARNLMADEGRKQARESQLNNQLPFLDTEAVNTNTPERIVLYREELSVLEQVIEQLPPKRRRVFILSRLHNMSYDEIAMETGLTKAGVKQHIVRALADCRLALAPLDQADVNTESAHRDTPVNSATQRR